MIKKDGPLALSFRTYGNGPEALLALHGYGQDHRAYEKFAAALSDRYTIYSFDLLLHGNSPGLPRPQALSRARWQTMIKQFLRDQAIDRFSLVGYSLGGRFALTLVETMAEQINHLILIAPDGIKSSRWYQFASGTWLGHWLLKKTVVNPLPFFRITTAAQRLNLVEKSVLKFAEAHMDTRSKRFRVYARWVAFRQIQPNLPRVIQACNSHQLKVEIFVGKYDAIVKTKAIDNFRKALINSDIHTLPCGHNGLIDEVGRFYASRP